MKQKYKSFMDLSAFHEYVTSISTINLHIQVVYTYTPSEDQENATIAT